MSYARADRVAELIRQEVAKLILDGVKDPRIGFVSVMDVRMSKDMRYADIFVSLYGSEAEKKGSMAALKNSSGWIRRELGKVLRMRYTPELRFLPDDTLDRAYHIEEVIGEIHEQERKQPMLRADLCAVLDELRKGERFLVVSHVHPDGDAVGSMLAMAHLLRALGKKTVHCALADPVPAVYRTLPGADKILTADAKAPEFDVAVIVDVASRERIGAISDWIKPRHRVVIVDHHFCDAPEGHIGCIDVNYAAVGEMLVELFGLAGIPIPKDAAHCAYVAQTTDTGGYRFSNTNARSHRIASELVEAGVDVPGISRNVFDYISRPKVTLLRLTLDRMEFRRDGRVAHSYITQQDIEEAGGQKEDLNGLVNYCGNIEGVRVGILFYGAKPALTKASFRSDQEFNSAKFLQPFGGGGHAAAAGITIEKPLEEVKTILLTALDAALEGAA